MNFKICASAERNHFRVFSCWTTPGVANTAFVSCPINPSELPCRWLGQVSWHRCKTLLKCPGLQDIVFPSVIASHCENYFQVGLSKRSISWAVRDPSWISSELPPLGMLAGQLESLGFGAGGVLQKNPNKASLSCFLKRVKAFCKAAFPFQGYCFNWVLSQHILIKLGTGYGGDVASRLGLPKGSSLASASEVSRAMHLMPEEVGSLPCWLSSSHIRAAGIAWFTFGWQPEQPGWSLTGCTWQFWVVACFLGSIQIEGLQ